MITNVKGVEVIYGRTELPKCHKLIVKKVTYWGIVGVEYYKTIYKAVFFVYDIPID